MCSSSHCSHHIPSLRLLFTFLIFLLIHFTLNHSIFLPYYRTPDLHSISLLVLRIVFPYDQSTFFEVLSFQSKILCFLIIIHSFVILVTIFVPRLPSNVRLFSSLHFTSFPSVSCLHAAVSFPAPFFLIYTASMHCTCLLPNV